MMNTSGSWVRQLQVDILDVWWVMTTLKILAKELPGESNTRILYPVWRTPTHHGHIMHHQDGRVKQMLLHAAVTAPSTLTRMNVDPAVTLWQWKTPPGSPQAWDCIRASS